MGILTQIETMDCPKCGKPTIKFIRKGFYRTTKKGFTGQSVNLVGIKPEFMLTDECENCGWKVK